LPHLGGKLIPRDRSWRTIKAEALIFESF